MNDTKIDLPTIQARALLRCKAEDFLKVTSGEQMTPEESKQLNDYLAVFLPPNKDLKCVNCDRQQGGMFGCFTYGIAHGEGYCAECGYPGRANHYPKEGPVESFVFILKYHPEEIESHE